MSLTRLAFILAILISFAVVALTHWPQPKPATMRIPHVVVPATAAPVRVLHMHKQRPTPTPTPTAASRSEQRTPVATTSSLRESRSDGALSDVTAYCATGNHTASGKWPTPGMVATLDRSIPFGTRVHIDTLGTFIVEDRIGYGSDFDVFLGGLDCEHRAAVFGRKQLRVEVSQ